MWEKLIIRTPYRNPLRSVAHSITEGRQLVDEREGAHVLAEKEESRENEQGEHGQVGLR